MLKRCRPLLGTFVEISAECEAAVGHAFAAMERVHRLMSAHEPDSDVSRINRFAHCEPVEVHGWTRAVLERGLYWSKASDGAFDVVRAGKAAIASGLLPRHADQPIPQAAAWPQLEIKGRLVRLLSPGCIDLGGIAKGFAADQAIEALASAACRSGLVNAGGDMRAFGTERWPVAVVDPLSRRSVAEVELIDNALATSAGLTDDCGSLRFDHLGGEGEWVSVSVRARSACDADALTKIVWQTGHRAARLLESVGAAAFALTGDGRIKAVGQDAAALA